MTEAGWISIVTLIISGLGSMLAAYIGLKQMQLKQGVDEAKIKIDETKARVEQTEGKVDESMLRLDGRLTKLLEQTELRVRAETRVEVEAEAKTNAEELVKTNTAAWEKQTKDEATAAALMLKTAADKAQMDIMERALADSEGRRAMQTSQIETLTEKKESADPAPTMVVEAQPQNVELHVAGSMTEMGEKAAEDKEKSK